ncbi:MAG: DUF177 domain-containing protein [Actinobacteria bacterium]|nr:DUF177 domain-containing protein [Actinomycetota bacterium]
MPPRPFLVSVTALRRSPAATVQHERRCGPLDGLAVTSTRVPSGAEVCVDVDLEAVHGGVMAHGTVSAPWEGECRRCLGTALGTLETEVRELFEPNSADDDTYRLRGEQLDLEPLARDAVLLELPQAPLCAEACQGLCPTCGANLNEGECSCEAQPTDPRWAALDALRHET